MTDLITDTVRELTGPVFRLINRIIGDREAARDLTQDLLVKLLRQPERIRGEIRPYLMQAAYHAALNARRNRTRENAAHETIRQAPGPDRPENPEQQLESAELRAQIESLVSGLADRQREAITLRFFAEMTVDEIAAAMNISEGSVRTHLARGLQQLRFYLAPIPD